MTGESSEDLAIGELSRLTGVPIKTIRYYSDVGLLPPRRRTAARYRRYGKADRLRLEQIRALRELGFGLTEIRRLLGKGGDPRAVIEAQARAIDREMRALARARAVLAPALSGDADPVAVTLRVGAVMRLAAFQREAALREHLSAPLRATAIDPGFVARICDAAFAGLPDELDDAQWAAYVELSALVTDPSFGEALARQARGFWPRRGFDAAAFQREMGELIARAAPLGPLDPEAPAAQRLADEYVALAARAMRREPSRRLEAWLLARAAEHDPRSERFWDLCAALRRAPPPPHARVMRIVHAALAARARA